MPLLPALALALPTPLLALPAAYTNGLRLPDLSGRPLSAESLSADADALAELAAVPNARTLVKYLVECALPAEAEIVLPLDASADGPLELHGALGLAPEWATGPCDEACQEWVSACLLSRANAYAVPFELTGRGENPGLPTRGDPEFTVEEGAFYGNMFVEPPEEFACRGRGNDPLALAFRACTLPGSRCAVAVVGDCGPVDAEGEPTARHACEGRAPGDLYYTACHRRASLPGEDSFPAEGDKVYRRVITTWLRPTGFRAAPAAAAAEACEGSPAPRGFPALGPAPGAPGDRCENDDACARDDLMCFAAAPGGMCTRRCEDSGDADAESAECGPGSTCLGFPGGLPLCTAACTPDVPGGDCPAGRVCTLPWNLVRPQDPHITGCMPFCSEDADCNPGTHCHRGSGNCTSMALPEGDALAALLADGEPCDPRRGGPCRGICVSAGRGADEGLCASLFNAARTETCETPNVLPYGPRQIDDLGICMFRRCAADRDCTSPLACVDTPVGRACGYR